MDEREMLVVIMGDIVSNFISVHPVFQTLIAIDLKRVNSDFYIEALNLLPEHEEQQLIDGIEVSIAAMRDIINNLQEKYSEKNISENLNIEKIINSIMNKDAK